MKSNRLQTGNVFFVLLAVVGLVGTVGAASVSLMKGPVTGMANVTSNKTVTADISAALTLLSRQALGSTGADCDGDGKIEPMPYRDAGASPKPVGGGYLPTLLGTTKIDPWKTEYGYCAWDHGTSVKAAGCGGASSLRLAGGDTTKGTVVAVISAGQDHKFQTSCTNWVSDSVDSVVRPANSDDIVSFISYEEFTTPKGGDAKLEELPDEACNPQNIGVMRRSMGVVQICMDTGWEEVGTSAQADTNFVDVIGAQLNETHTSNEITFTGFLTEKNVTVKGSAILLVNGAVRSLPAVIQSGDKISLRANAATVPETTLTFGVSVGGVQRDWTIRTRNRYPAALSITPSSVTNMHVRGPSDPAYGSATGFVVKNTGEIATVALSSAVLSNTTHFEFTGSGDGCVGEILEPGETCAIDIRSKATFADDRNPISGSLSVVAGTISAIASPLSGTANGWTCTSPWGGTRINSGSSITAYNITAPTTCNGSCTSIQRTCTEDVLSGSETYQYQNCNPLESCTYSWQTGAWSACSAAPSWSGWSGWGTCSAAPTWSGWSGWGGCSASCGGGTQSRSRTCSGTSGSQSRTRTCSGTSGTQTRTVTCLRNDGVTVPDSECTVARAGAKPATSQACTTNCSGSATESQSCTSSCSGSATESQSCNTEACLYGPYYRESDQQMAMWFPNNPTGPVLTFRAPNGGERCYIMTSSAYVGQYCYSGGHTYRTGNCRVFYADGKCNAYEVYASFPLY